MVQTGSDAPVNTGTAPAAPAADTTATVKAVDVAPKAGDSGVTTLQDAIRGSSIGAGDPTEDLNSVRRLNGQTGSDTLGLPPIEIHDPTLAEDNGVGDATNGGIRSGNGGPDATNDDTSTTTTDATNHETSTTGTDAPTPPVEAGDTTDGGNTRAPKTLGPRDASPFGRDRSRPAAQLNTGTNHNVDSPAVKPDGNTVDAKLEPSGALGAGMNGALKPLRSGTNHELTTSAANEAVKQPAESARTDRRPESPHDKHHRPGLFQRQRRHR